MCQHTAQSAGAIYAWEFERDGKVFTVKGDGQLVFNSIVHVLNGALDGVGLSYIPEALAAPCLADGRLEEVLADWCPYFPGFHFNTMFAAEAVLRSYSASCQKESDQRNSCPLRYPRRYQRPAALFPRQPIHGPPSKPKTRPSYPEQPRCATPPQAAPACGKFGHRRHYVRGVNWPDADGQASCYQCYWRYQPCRQQRTASRARIANGCG